MGLDETDRLKLAGAAGLIGGLTRAGKALYNRLTKPGNQAAAAEALIRAMSRLETAGQPLGLGVPALLIEAEARK